MMLSSRCFLITEACFVWQDPSWALIGHFGATVVLFCSAFPPFRKFSRIFFARTRKNCKCFYMLTKFQVFYVAEDDTSEKFKVIQIKKRQFASKLSFV